MAQDPKDVLYSKLAFLLAVTASDQLAEDIASGAVNTGVFNTVAYVQMMKSTGFDKTPANQHVFNALATVRDALSSDDIWPDDECDWPTIQSIIRLGSAAAKAK